jgi:hypothetical protein
MAVRAKFTVLRHEVHVYQGNLKSTTIVMAPLYDQTIPEDQRFATATPSGELRMTVDNPAAREQMPPGKAFYVDFTAELPATD